MPCKSIIFAAEGCFLLELIETCVSEVLNYILNIEGPRGYISRWPFKSLLFIYYWTKLIAVKLLMKPILCLIIHK